MANKTEITVYALCGKGKYQTIEAFSSIEKLNLFIKEMGTNNAEHVCFDEIEKDRNIFTTIEDANHWLEIADNNIDGYFSL